MQIGDVVEVESLGRRFHALVIGSATAVFPSIRWTDESSTRLAVRTTWSSLAKRGRARQTNKPLKPPPLQVEFDATVHS